MTRYASIVATGSYLPKIEMPNDVLRERFADLDGFVDKMEAKTGIQTRWYAPEDWASSDLALPAAQQALERAGRRPEDIDLLIVGTDSPDYITPATSTVLQHKLGAKNAGTFDVGCACASFPTGLAAASGWIAANPAVKTVLVVGVYLMHRLAAEDDPMIFFYGDGAGAAVLEPASEPGFINATSVADGAYAEHWGLYAGATAEPASVEAIEAGRTQVKLIERYPPEVNNEGWPQLVRRLADEGGFVLQDIDLLIFSQVRKTSIELVMETLELPIERAHMIMERSGYTGSASLGMAFHDAVEKEVVGPGDLVVFIGSGVGYNQAGTAFRLGSNLAYGSSPR
ncbi:MAG: ketoacyl-ACP synthase III [Acidobacteriota bacterium]